MTSDRVVTVEGPQPRGEVIVQPKGSEVIAVIQETGPMGPQGPQGEPGPTGATGQGVLVLYMDEPVPPGTPDNTVIFRREPG